MRGSTFFGALLLVPGLLLAGVACGDDGGPPVTPDTGGVDAGGTDSGGGTDSSTPPDASQDPDAGRDAGPPPVCEGGDSYTYVLSLLAVGGEDPPGSGMAFGFDLDNRVSDSSDLQGCRHDDFTSPAPDSIPGVDNQIGLVLDDAGMGLADQLRADLEAAIAMGQLIALVRVSQVDDLTDDDCVDVELLFGLLPEGVTMPMVDASNRLVPGQTFDLDSASLEADMMSSKVRFERSRIVAGRVLATGAAELPLEFPTTAGDTLTLLLVQPQARFDITADALSNGMLGGAIENEAAITTFATVSSMIDPILIRTVIETYADLFPTGGPTTCTHISIGGEFEGVSAVEGIARPRP